MARIIEIEGMITVGTLAEKLSLPVTRLISELMKNGVMATVNERIDFDTAQIVVGELGLDVELSRKDATQAISSKREKRVASETAISRPPIVAVMGHVDHGKTTLLDAIRDAHVAKTEAGGITQHISAYQIKYGERAITFLDTPGHEAFAAIREHGAHLTDIAIIVVAADDGIKPQTLEAIRYARSAGTKIIVAINKIDKEGSDPNRAKQQLSEHGLLPEDWGGDTVMVEVSALKRQGIDTLLDMVLLVADVEDLRADKDEPARGLIIESRIEQGRGPIANALIENGTLKSGDFVVAGTTYAKVRVLESTNGVQIDEALPSSPVTIIGFKALPAFGNEFFVVKNEKEARSQAAQAAEYKKGATNAASMNSSELIRMINRKNQLSELNVIVRTDVQGSLTSVVDSLKTLDTDEVSVRIVSSGVGPVTDGDIQMAATSDAVIYAFHVPVPMTVKRLAAREKVSIRAFSIIYELIDDAKERLTSMLAPEVIESDTGRLIVRAVFKTTKTGGICGGEVTKGKLVAPALARVLRDDTQIAEIEVAKLKRGPQEVKEVPEGDMCGVEFTSNSRLELQEGDKLEFFTRRLQSRTL